MMIMYYFRLSHWQSTPFGHTVMRVDTCERGRPNNMLVPPSGVPPFGGMLNDPCFENKIHELRLGRVIYPNYTRRCAILRFR